MKLSLRPETDGPDVIIRVYRIPAGEIGYLTNLCEAYEGIGLVRTLDRARGVIECWIMPDFEDVFEGMLASLRAEFPIQPMGDELE